MNIFCQPKSVNPRIHYSILTVHCDGEVSDTVSRGCESSGKRRDGRRKQRPEGENNFQDGIGMIGENYVLRDSYTYWLEQQPQDETIRVKQGSRRGWAILL